MYHSRTIVIALAGLTFGAFSAPAASADPFLSVPPASFLNYHVASVSELSQEVALDPLVRARLARHFHRTEPDMTAYIRENLTLTRLPKAGVYRVACVTPSGREYSITERLAAGTPVFASTRTGKPILKLACGNPLVSSLPPAPPKPKPVAKVRRKPALLAPTDKTPEAEAPVSGSLETFTFTAPTALTEMAPAGLAPLTQVGGVQQALTSKGGGFPFLPIVAVGGVAALLPKGGGSGPAPVMPIGPSLPIAPPASPAVPEPSPLLLLGLGGAALAAWRARSRRS